MTPNVQAKHLQGAEGTSPILQSGSEKLRGLCEALALGEQTEHALALFTRLVSSDHHTGEAAGTTEGFAPYEFALVAAATPELRLVVELAGSGAQIAAMLRDLAQNEQLDPGRFEKVQDLFFPEKRRGAFAARIGVSFAAGRKPTFEVYLDPSVAGRTRAPLLIERSLVRFGFTAAWPCIGQRLTLRGPDEDELKYVAIDLSSAAPIVKVYARHLHSTVAVLDAAASVGLSYRPNDVAGFLNGLSVGQGSFDGLAPMVCYEFSKGPGARPNTVGLEFPICGYATHDAAIEQRVLASMNGYGVSGAPYSRAVAAVAEGPLAAGVGLQSYVAFARDDAGNPTVAVRFPMQLSPRGKAPDPDQVAPPSGVMEVVDRYEQWDAITNHPFLHRLRSEPVNLHHIWYILANFQGSISKTFSQRLALIASRCDDAQTRYIVTDLLYDEMGSGDFKIAHVNLFANMMKVMEPWKPAVIDDWTLKAAERFNGSMDVTYSNPDVNVALGAIVSGEIFGKQFDQFLGDEIRRQNDVDPALFVWVTLHESLEVTHAGEGADIARLVPPEGFEAMTRGAYGLALGAWGFLTDCYELCYGGRPPS